MDAVDEDFEVDEDAPANADVVDFAVVVDSLGLEVGAGAVDVDVDAAADGFGVGEVAVEIDFRAAVLVDEDADLAWVEPDEGAEVVVNAVAGVVVFCFEAATAAAVSLDEGAVAAAAVDFSFTDGAFLRVDWEDVDEGVEEVEEEEEEEEAVAEVTAAASGDSVAVTTGGVKAAAASKSLRSGVGDPPDSRCSKRWRKRRWRKRC